MNQFAQSVKFSDQLSTMPDQMLPRLAQQYKDDAITLSLILSEKNRRERTRGAASAQQAGQSQPKVNEAVVSEMMQSLPEDTGIAQLPAPNMEQMYDGGLVSFAGGGEVERYQNKGLVDGGTIYDPVTGVPISSEEVSDNDLTMLESLGVFNPENRRALERAEKAAEKRAAAQKRPAINYNQATMPAPGYTRGDPRALPTMPSAENQMGANVPPSAAPGAAPSTRGPAQPQMNNPPPMVAQPEVDALAQYQRDISQFKPAQGRTAAAELAARQALVPEEYRGKAYAGLEKSLQGDAETAGKEKDQSFWMSVMQAGLSAASGTSPNALKNIADGMNVGLSSYKESLKEFKKAEKERQKAMADIEQARRAEARGDADTAIKATERSEDRMDKFNGYSMQGIAALRSQEMQERGSTARTNAQIAANRENAIIQERGANTRNAATIAAQLNTPDRLVFNKLVEDNKGDPIKAAEALQKMKAEKFNMYEAYSKYLTGFAGKETLTPPMDFDQFASKFMVSTTKNPGKGATILTQP